MGVALSYATPAQTADQESSNEALAIKFNPGGPAFDAAKPTFECIDDFNSWDPDKLIYTLPDYVTQYSISVNPADNSKVTIVYPDIANEAQITITAKFDTNKYALYWYPDPSGTYSGSMEIYPIFDFNKIPVPDGANLATVAGVVNISDYSNAQNNPLAGAEVALENRLTAEVIAKTVTGSNGEFSFNKVTLNGLKDAVENETYIIVISYHGYFVSPEFLSAFDVRDVIKDKEVVFADINAYASIADVNFYGAEHHANYIFSLEAYVGDEIIDELSIKFSAPCLGLPSEEFFQNGADFTIDEKGVMSATIKEEIKMANTNGKDDAYMNLSAQPIPEDGYSFDYVDINSQQYRSGDTFHIANGAKLDATVNYKANQIAQTGDAAPFAVLIALGIIAGLSVVAIRKFSK